MGSSGAGTHVGAAPVGSTTSMPLMLTPSRTRCVCGEEELVAKRAEAPEWEPLALLSPGEEGAAPTAAAAAASAYSRP